MMTPPLVAGAALAFVSAIGNFGIPALLGIPAGYTVLPTLIYSGWQASARRSSPTSRCCRSSSARSPSSASPSSRCSSAAATTGRVGAPVAGLRYPLGRARPFVEAGAWAIIVLILVIPLIALLATSLVSAYGVALIGKDGDAGELRRGPVPPGRDGPGLPQLVPSRRRRLGSPDGRLPCPSRPSSSGGRAGSCAASRCWRKCPTPCPASSSASPRS